ncbi:hypothetical protein [Persicobacter diffluens]|uniref:Uncharacterized protein n=1 Tax=Persicobacter diffluens TaxID=981 RepID=A0AAN4VZP3_9BACT|nr:hypothetical protein PEDI_32600 [Persicobacter diffluens]
MEKEQYLNELEEIRTMMSKSSKFLSLSGYSGISAGVIALLGGSLFKYYYWGSRYQLGKEDLIAIIGLGVITLCLVLALTLFFSWRKGKKQGLSLWNSQSQQLLYHMLAPLIPGGIICLHLVWNNNLPEALAMSQVFYGLALFSSARYTIGAIKSLGLIEISLGLFAYFLPQWADLFWLTGFGVLHLIYGGLMQKKEA